MKIYETNLLIDEVHKRLFNAGVRPEENPNYRQVDFISSSCRATKHLQIIDAVYRVGPSSIRAYPLIGPSSQTSLTRIDISAEEAGYEKKTLDILERLLGDLTPVPRGLTIKQELEQLARSSSQISAIV